MMREAQISSRLNRYKSRSSADQRVVALWYIIILFLLLFTISTKNKLLLFFFVTALSTIVNYQTNMTTIRFNPDPEVFSSLLLTQIVGLYAGLFMLLIPSLFVDIYTARFDKDTFISLMLTILANILLSLLDGPFVTLGIVLVTAKFFIGLFLNLMLNISLEEIVFEHLLGFISNIFLFLVFGAVMVGLF